MQSLSTSRASAHLSLVEQGVEAARPKAVRESSQLRRVMASLKVSLRGLWHWIEQPEAPAPPSRPVVSNFFVNL